MVNRLEARKNTVRLVRLWCGLPADLKRRWRLVIVGRGEEEVAVLSFLRESGEDSVALLGEQVGHERWLDRADLFILASEREGNPNALMEAAASGIRVLVTDIHGVGDCLPATARGAVFSLGDPRDLESVGRERLSACLEAIDLGSAAPGSGGGREATAPLRAAAGSLFGPEMVCGRYLWLYERLLAGPRPGVIRS
jgi:glycosyltransferase involved in cell wall biosynthesis